MEALQIIVNGQVLDLPEKPQASITFEANNIGDLSDRNGDFGKTFDLPMTGKNRVIFGLSDQIGSSYNAYIEQSCQVFLNNWSIFSGKIKLVRYFGNQIQVQLIGGLGTLLSDIREKTLGDFSYPNFKRVICGNADYDALLETEDDGVMVIKADGGWSESRVLQVNVPKFYPVQMPLAYRLRSTIEQLVNELGYALVGDITTDDLIAYVFIQQGHWGQNRELQAYDGGVVVAEDPATFFRLRYLVNAVTNLNVTSSDLPWADTVSQQFTNVQIANGRYKIKISWDFTDANPAAFETTWKVALFVSPANVSNNYETVAVAEATITLTEIDTGPGSFEMDFVYANTVGGQITFASVYQSGTVNRVVDLYGLKAELTYEWIDEPCFFQIMRAQDCLPRITVSDFLLEVCQRFGYVLTANVLNGEVRFDKQVKLLDRSVAYDWNGKVYTDEKVQFVNQYETLFEYGSYAAKNYWKDENGQRSGYLIANVANKLSEQEVYTSIANEVTLEGVRTAVTTVTGQTFTKTYGVTGNENLVVPVSGQTRSVDDVFFFNGVGIESTNSGLFTGTTPYPNFNITNFQRTWNIQQVNEVFDFQNEVVVFGKKVNAEGPATVQQDTANNYTVVNNCLALDYATGGWQSVLDDRYGWLQSILTSQRIHKVLVRIRPTDLPIDFTRPIYWNCAYWYLVSLQDWNPINGETAVAVLAYLPDF